VQSLARHVRQGAVARARKARWQVLAVIPLIAGVVLAYSHRVELFGVDTPVRIGAVVSLVVLGWTLARDLGRALGPILLDRLDPGTAGSVGFLIRLFTLVITVLVALQLAGLTSRTVAVGGAITAVVLGLAGQQTLGNVIAGTVLLSASPFRVGDRIRLHAGGLAGQTEGVVTSLGLLYTTLASGEDRILVPNNVVLASAVVPLREPSGVDVRARLAAEVKPSQIQSVLEDAVDIPMRSDPHIALEEVDGEEVVLRVSAVPVDPSEGPELADQVLASLQRASREAA
jgi:small conductance mechanosensitive channel